MIVKRDEDDSVEVKEIANGFLVVFRGRNKEGDWLNQTLYFERLNDAFDSVSTHFDLPTY